MGIPSLRGLGAQKNDGRLPAKTIALLGIQAKIKKGGWIRPSSRSCRRRSLVRRHPKSVESASCRIRIISSGPSCRLLFTVSGNPSPNVFKNLASHHETSSRKRFHRISHPDKNEIKP
jgi:hypothetical protein